MVGSVAMRPPAEPFYSLPAEVSQNDCSPMGLWLPAQKLEVGIWSNAIIARSASSTVHMTVTPSLELSSEHQMIQQAAREFAQNEIAPIAAEHDESGEFPAETIRKMGKMGFMGIEISEQYGGSGLDTLSYVLALTEISKADAAHGTIMSVNNSLYCNAIERFGTEQQKEKFLAPGRFRRSDRGLLAHRTDVRF